MGVLKTMDFSKVFQGTGYIVYFKQIDGFPVLWGEWGQPEYTETFYQSKHEFCRVL